MVRRAEAGPPRALSKNENFSSGGFPSAIVQATIFPSSGTTNEPRSSATLIWYPVVRETATQGVAGQAGATSVLPTSTIFADAGAAVTRAATSAARPMNGRWLIARMKHDEVPGDSLPPGLRPL